MNGEDSPAFEFVKRNYDVWLFNIRGNTFSRQHETLDPALDPEYWDYTLDDIRYDFMA